MLYRSLQLQREKMKTTWSVIAVLFLAGLCQTQALTCLCTASESHLCPSNKTCIADKCIRHLSIFANGSLMFQSAYCHSVGVAPCITAPSHTDSNRKVYTVCCDNKDYCNECLDDFKPDWNVSTIIGHQTNCTNFNNPKMTILPSVSASIHLPTPSHASDAAGISTEDQICLVAAVLVMIVFVAVILTIILCFCKKLTLKSQPSDMECVTADMEYSTGSVGSSGMSNKGYLAQRTISDDLVIGKCLGSGRYGKVYLGTYKGDKIAIKHFNNEESKSFKTEYEVYSIMNGHNNVLRYIAQDNNTYYSKYSGLSSCLFLEYHPLGSLADYLRTDYDLQVNEKILLCLSLVSGLEYLHRDIVTTGSNKPGIAHRDLKSSNVLVKDSRTLCIGDLGLAVIHDGDGGVTRMPSGIEGTRRYLPPEVLSNSMNYKSFQHYKMADIYSVALVMWEIVNRSIVKCDTGMNAWHSQPYAGLVADNPTAEQIKVVIVDQNVRPQFRPDLARNKAYRPVVTLIEECWRTEPTERPSALNIKKKFKNLVCC